MLNPEFTSREDQYFTELINNTVEEIMFNHDSELTYSNMIIEQMPEHLTYFYSFSICMSPRSGFNSNESDIENKIQILFNTISNSVFNFDFEIIFDNEPEKVNVLLTYPLVDFLDKHILSLIEMEDFEYVASLIKNYAENTENVHFSNNEMLELAKQYNNLRK